VVIYASSCVQIDTRYLNINLSGMRNATPEIIMAKDNKKSKKTADAENGSTVPSSDDTNIARQIVVNAQYIKDLSFENPNAPRVLIEGASQPDVEITVNVGAQLLGDNQYEVTLKIAAKATANDTALFLVDLAYAGLVSPQGTPDDEINALIMIEAPRLLFPFARAIISDCTRDGGFMPLNIQPVDFVAVYQHNLAQQAAAQKNN
jgi:preprotein translocase subunit SecB